MRWLKRKSRPARRRGNPQPWRRSFQPSVESLGDRILPSVTALFAPGTHVLSVLGDNQDNTIIVSRDTAGDILVNGGAVRVRGGAPTVANTALIQVFGQAGNDTIALDETNGALPGANLFGGAGNDTLTGGSGNDMLFGQAGNDTLFGKGGADQLFGGDGDDVLVGGTGNDQVFGGAGNDLMIWNNGDGTDLNEGGTGIDTVEVNGSNAADQFTVAPNGTRVRFDRTNLVPFSLDIGTTENLVVNMNGGDDVFTASNGLAPLIALTVDGGAGNDTITGGDGNDVLFGGDGNDVIEGGRGNDTMFGGAGDDVFTWDPGDGSDVIEGQGGHDTMQFTGSNLDEHIDISANGRRVRFFRDVGNVTMDLNGVEQIDFSALGGADNITVNDLTGTDVTEVNVDLAAPAGSGTGDGQADNVIVNATKGNDTITVTGDSSAVKVSGLAARVNITGAEARNDQLRVNALAGDDVVNASGLTADAIALTVDGGDGNDTITGGAGNDVLIGGAGNDVIEGGRGNDTMFGGAGDDVFTWDPGDGSDVIEGQGGHDTMQFTGANVDEHIDISANGQRVRFFRDVGNVTMDLNGVEQIDFQALGGADIVTVNDLSGTDVTDVNIDLADASGTGDGQADTVIINGTRGDDVMTVDGDAAGINVNGLAARVHITGSEARNDQLVINALDGNDVVVASQLAAGAIQFTANGGNGDNVLVGSQGDDKLTGGPGNDILIGGPGLDILDGGPGYNILIQ
jgi:Ca2+-binding RTX toxin-like protein